MLTSNQKLHLPMLLKQTVQYPHLTKDDAFKGFMSNGHCICQPCVFLLNGYFSKCPQQPFEKVNKLPPFFIGDCPPLSPIGISTTTSNTHSRSNNTRFPSNSMTSEFPAGDIDLAVSTPN